MRNKSRSGARPAAAHKVGQPPSVSRATSLPSEPSEDEANDEFIWQDDAPRQMPAEAPPLAVNNRFRKPLYGAPAVAKIMIDIIEQLCYDNILVAEEWVEALESLAALTRSKRGV